MSSYHVFNHPSANEADEQRACGRLRTSNRIKHARLQAEVPQERGATRRVRITRMTTNTSAARATRCARSVCTTPDRRRPRGSMRPATCHYQAASQRSRSGPLNERNAALGTRHWAVGTAQPAGQAAPGFATMYCWQASAAPTAPAGAVIAAFAPVHVSYEASHEAVPRADTSPNEPSACTRTSCGGWSVIGHTRGRF